MTVTVSADIRRAIEAILMVAQEPVDPHLLAQLIEVSPAVIDEAIVELQRSYLADARGFELVAVAGGYRFQSAPDLTAYVERFALEGQSARLSNAALETLAIVAYKQPLSRAQIAAIRGVNVDGVMRTLQQRGYIEEVGRDAGPGQATLFGTSREFLERLGLNSLDDLPPINELFPSAEVMEALEQTLRADPARTVDPPAGSGVLSAPDADPAAERADVDRSSEPASRSRVEEYDDLPAKELATHTEQERSENEDEGVAPGAAADTATPDPFAFTDPGDDEFPEPVPPAWAVDADVDGDGRSDHPADP